MAAPRPGPPPGSVTEGISVMRVLRVALVLATLAAGSSRAAAGDTPKSTVAADEQLLKQANLGIDGPALLASLPFATNEEIADEIRTSLTVLAVHDGKAEPALLKALTDRSAIIRGSAGEVLTRAKVADAKAAVRKLLTDLDASVKLRVA